MNASLDVRFANCFFLFLSPLFSVHSMLSFELSRSV